MVLAERPYAQAYASLRSGLCGGMYRPGSRLKAADIAQALKLSPTPVREALATLSGEGLVYRHRDEGYFVPELDASEIANLYAFERRCFINKMSDSRRMVPSRLPLIGKDTGATSRDICWATEWLAAQSGNSVFVEMVCRINDRLSAVRRAEALTDISGVWPWQEVVDQEVLRQAVLRYLQQCVGRAAEIAMISRSQDIYHNII